MIPVLTKKRLYDCGIRKKVDTQKLRIEAQMLLNKNPNLTPMVAVKMAWIEMERKRYQ